MYRVLIIACAVLLMFAVGAQASDPPAHGGYAAGWGMNPTNWDAASGSWSAWGLYAWPGPGGGSGWVVSWGNPIGYIQYDPITIDLWIEMYCMQTYHYTSYQYHRLGNAAEHLCFLIQGTIQSNEGLFVSLQNTPGVNPNVLDFVHNIGVGDNDNQRDIPITWSGRWGAGNVYGDRQVWPTAGYGSLTWVDNQLLYPAQIPACDHWFEFQGCMDIVYHEADGHYSLTLAGCPAPEL